MSNRKRQRRAGSATLLEAALHVLLNAHSDFVAGHEACVALVALTRTSHSLRRLVHQWAKLKLREDITRGHEGMAMISVRAPDGSEAGEYAPTLAQLLMLLRFQYATTAWITVPHDSHRLPDEQIQRLREENDDVKRVLRGCHVRLYAAYNPNTGWGIHATQRILCGEYVGEYTGELVSSPEASRRYESVYDRLHLNYVVSLRERMSARDGVVRTNVDATRIGCFTRFFNHSCEPTLRMEAVRVDSFVPRLVLFTRREVEPGEQLTYDYGSGEARQRREQRQEREGSSHGNNGETHMAVRCHCGAASCRGLMPFDGTL